MFKSQNNQFYSDLDFDPMTLVLKLDLDMVKMYHHRRNEVSMSRYSKVNSPSGQRHTHRQYENITFPHTRAVITPPPPTTRNGCAKMERAKVH